MDGAYLVFRWLVGRIAGFLWAILQWVAVRRVGHAHYEIRAASRSWHLDVYPTGRALAP